MTMHKIPKTPLTRQHFEYFAWCAAYVVDENLHSHLKNWLSDVLSVTNPAFDEERFTSRCDQLRKEYKQTLLEVEESK